MSTAGLADFLWREMAPTPGRGGATFRLTVACVIATIPVLTHRVPHALVVMIVMYLITQEDTAATLLGSILGVLGVTLGLGAALLALMVSIDIAWLRIGFYAAFLFGGLFLKRILTVGALGSAIGLPAALVMIIPDVMSVPHAFAPSEEMITEFALWIWLCVALGLAVNVVVQLLLAPGDPLTLLQRELDTRLRVVAETLRALGGPTGRPTPSLTASLASLATAGMTRPLALLRTASLTQAWARQRHEELSAIITLADRLVTDAGALVTLWTSDRSNDLVRTRVNRIAEACEGMRGALAARRRPAAGLTAPPTEGPSATSALPPLDDMEWALDQLALATELGATGEGPRKAPLLVVPDAFRNPEYVRFALKGTVAALTCYVLFIGFDYPGIYTSVITCFVVSLSTIGASNQKGLLRFGGAAAGGLMGLIALVYAFPNVDGIGGFWLVFGTGTAVAAWVNFGTPRISYGGYQTGLAFYKAVLQGFAPVVSATVVRDRLIGVFFGLTVFAIVEHLLWPVRARDQMRARMADVLASLADLARRAGEPEAGRAIDVDARRRLISQQVAEVLGFVESSKFERGADNPEEVGRLLAGAQTVLLILLAQARAAQVGASLAVREATARLEADVAAALGALANHIRGDRRPPTEPVEAALDGSERRLAEWAAAVKEADDRAYGRLVLHRELVAAVRALISIEREPDRVQGSRSRG